jgi:hypothetical protein
MGKLKLAVHPGCLLSSEFIADRNFFRYGSYSSYLKGLGKAVAEGEWVVITDPDARGRQTTNMLPFRIPASTYVIVDRILPVEDWEPN